jgi:protein-tyrosine phosphatase
MSEFGVTHVLNLAPYESAKFRFEDDYNYLEVPIRDEEGFSLKSVLDKCFEFIDEGRFRGNCLIHCHTAKPGLSRSTAICIAYLMGHEKKSYEQSFADVSSALLVLKS